MRGRLAWLLIGLCSCVTRHAADYRQAEAAAVERAREVSQVAYFASDRAADQAAQADAALAYGDTNQARVAITNAITASEVSAQMLERGQALLGPPATNQAERARALLSTNAGTRAEAQRGEAQRAAGDGAVIARRNQERSALASLGAEAEAANRKGAVRRFWGWLVASLGIGGAVAALVMFPALLPLLGSLAGWLAGKLPVFASYVGVVSKQAYARAVAVIQKSKTELENGGMGASAAVIRKHQELTRPESALVGSIKKNL